MYRVVFPNRWFIWTLVIIFAVFIVVMGAIWKYAIDVYYQGEETARSFEVPRKSQNQLDTSTWKTYRNEKYGFELKYPDDWDDSWLRSHVNKNHVFIYRNSKYENYHSSAVPDFNTIAIFADLADYGTSTFSGFVDAYSSIYRDLDSQSDRQKRYFSVEDHLAIEMNTESSIWGSLNPAVVVFIERKPGLIISIYSEYAYPVSYTNDQKKKDVEESKKLAKDALTSILSTLKFFEPIAE